MYHATLKKLSNCWSKFGTACHHFARFCHFLENDFIYVAHLVRSRIKFGIESVAVELTGNDEINQIHLFPSLRPWHLPLPIHFMRCGSKLGFSVFVAFICRMGINRLSQLSMTPVRFKSMLFIRKISITKTRCA